MMNPENPVNLLNSLIVSDPKTFKPFEMYLVKDFNKNPDLIIDLNSVKSDEYEKRGLILQQQKVNKYI
jgi:hypothetical protein